jgi:hypothetical protein
MGDMIFYQINGITYTRRKPGKRTNAQKERMKKSPLNERSQGMFAMVQKFSKLFGGRLPSGTKSIR